MQNNGKSETREENYTYTYNVTRKKAHTLMQLLTHSRTFHTYFTRMCTQTHIYTYMFTACSLSYKTTHI